MVAEGAAFVLQILAVRPRRVCGLANCGKLERCPSGLRSTLGKRVCVDAYRGFESHPLRQPFHIDAVPTVVPCRGDPGSGRLAAREPGQALTGAAMSVTVGVLRAPVFVLFSTGGLIVDVGASGCLRGVVVDFTFHLTACGAARARFR